MAPTCQSLSCPLSARALFLSQPLDLFLTVRSCGTVRRYGRHNRLQPFDQDWTVRSCCTVRRSERHTRCEPSDQNPTVSSVSPNVFVHSFSLTSGPNSFVSLLVGPTTAIVISNSVIFFAESSSEPPLLISQAPSDKIQSPTKTF